MKVLGRNQLKSLKGGLMDDSSGTCGFHGTYSSNEPFNHYGYSKDESIAWCKSINAGGGHCKWCCASCSKVMDIN